MVGRIAEHQDRIVRREQLTAAGLSESTVDRMLERGQLIRVFPGVYLVGVPGLSHREFLRACVAFAGPHAWPDGRSCLELRALLPVKTGVATLLTTRDLETPIRTDTELRDGGLGVLKTRRVRSADEVQSELVDGFLTTSLVRAFADLAVSDGPSALARAWREATFLSLLDAPAIKRELDERRRPGNPAVRERLRNAPPVTRPGMVVRSRSGELAFLELVRELGLPEPLVNVPILVNGFRLVPDFRWLNGLVVETDGGMHDLPWHQLEDAERTAHLESAGLRVYRQRNSELGSDWFGSGRRLLDAYAAQERLAALSQPRSVSTLKR